MPKRLTPKGQAAPPVEPNIAQAHITKKPAKKRAAKTPIAETSDTKYVRNLHQIKARVTLTTGREIQLEPRGQREDLDIVTADEREDPKFIANHGLIFEVVDAELAREIISKQQTNSRSQESPLWQHLRNAQGKEYTNRTAQIEEAFERQGIVVGRVEETGDGRYSQDNVEVVRTTQAGPHFSEVPGSPGHPATDYMLQQVPEQVDPEEYAEFLAWREFKKAQAKARNESSSES